MKIGLISDIKHADISEELGLWTIGRVLKERGMLAVVMQEPESDGLLSGFAIDQFTICAASKEQLDKFGIYRQMKGYITANKRLYEELHKEKEAGGKALLYLKHPLLLANQVSLHGLAKKPELEEFVFVDFCNWNQEKCGWLAEFCRQRNIRNVVAVNAPDKESIPINASMLVPPAQAKMSVPNMDGIRGFSQTGKLGETSIPKSIDGIEFLAVECGPEQYLGYVWMAKAVVTDTYLGTALAALHEKEFAVFYGAPAQQLEQIEDMLEILHLKEQVVKEDTDCRNSYVITDIQNFRKALHTYRDEQIEQMEQQLHLDDADVLVKCPVKLPVSQCSGCGACEAACPENAIRLEMDKKGFWHPVFDPVKCSECDWCINACPKKGRRQLVQYASGDLPKIYVGEVLSEDGNYDAYSGFFRELAHFALSERHGVVFGSRLNENLEPVLSWTREESETAAFAEQRFLISRKTQAFRKVKEFLEQGEFVLFAGIPCECAGLKSYLNRNYTKLFVCEFLCHSTVSEKLFHKYTDFLSEKQGAPMEKLYFGNFPAKSMAASKTIVSHYKGGGRVERKYNASPYYQMIEQQLPANEACSNCSYNIKKKVGDITIGELRNLMRGEVPKEWKNYSIIMANTEKGRRVLTRLEEKASLVETDYDTLLRYQYKKNAALPKERADLFKRLDKESMKDILRVVSRN